MAIDIAERIGAVVISVDSMQVYRGMDIGTAKPTLIERRGIPRAKGPVPIRNIRHIRNIGLAVRRG